DEGTKQIRDKLGVVSLRAPPPLTEYRLPAYAWLSALQAAAAGDYDAAAANLNDLRARLDREVSGNLAPLRVSMPLAVGCEVSVRAHPGLLPIHALAGLQRLTISGLLARTQLLQLELADLGVLEGLLALERGQPGAAERSLREADALAAVSGWSPIG